jgi:hypothetical protein
MEKLKPGWKRDADGTPVSPDDWRSRYCVRAVVIPVASPAEHGKGSQEQWTQLRETLKDAWIRSTEAANWALRRLLANDVTRTPGDTKCPKMPKIYLYGERDWTGWSQSASAVLRTIEASYRSKRYQVVWTGGVSLPNVRYPYPYPVHNTLWKLYENPDGGLFFECRLPEQRVSMRLKGGSEYRHQLMSARWLIQNPHCRCEASIYTRGKQIVVKLVGWFPKEERAKTNGIMFIDTAEQSFLVARNARDEQLWIIHGDRCRDWIVRHDQYMQRWHDDRKYELRRPSRESRKYCEDMQAKCQKNNDRIDSFIKESAAQCVNHAKRRNLAKIIYNDSCQTLFPRFPWYQMRLALQQKCESAGIEFELSSGAEEADSARELVTEGVDAT